MTRPSLAGIEQRTAAATEGPWVAWEVDAGFVTRPDKSPDEDEFWVAEGYEEPDAEFFAHARDDVPAMSAAIRDVLAECERFRFKGRGAPDDMPTEFDEGADTVATAILRTLAAHIDLTDPEGDPT